MKIKSSSSLRGTKQTYQVYYKVASFLAMTCCVFNQN